MDSVNFTMYEFKSQGLGPNDLGIKTNLNGNGDDSDDNDQP